jgi:hypothetical protein
MAWMAAAMLERLEGRATLGIHRNDLPIDYRLLSPNEMSRGGERWVHLQ